MPHSGKGGRKCAKKCHILKEALWSFGERQRTHSLSHGPQTLVRSSAHLTNQVGWEGPLDGRKTIKIKTAKKGKSQPKKIFL